MSAPANKRDWTKYCEFHEDHGHDTNDCIDLRQEIEACIWKGRMAHLAKGVKTDNHNQHTRPLGSKDTQEDWSRKMGNDSKPRNEIQMVQTMNAKAKSSSMSLLNITFFEYDLIPENYSGDNLLLSRQT